MAWRLAVLLLLVSAPYIRSQAIPNFKTTLYVVNLPVVKNEETHLTTFMENRFDSAGTVTAVDVERLGACVKVKVSLKEGAGQDGAGQEAVTSLTASPVNINKFSGGPFQVTQGRNDTLCPEAVPNFISDFFVLNIIGEVDKSVVKTKITELVMTTGHGWEYLDEIIGSCLRVYIEAVLTEDEENTVSEKLDTLEDDGLSVGSNNNNNNNNDNSDTTYTVTSNTEQALPCFQDYYQNDCEEGQKMCSYVKKCVPESAFCDGKDDCGNMADETNCKCEEVEGRRACDNRQFCLMERVFCDSQVDCADGSDELDCHFEEFKIEIVTQASWNSGMANSKPLAETLDAFLTSTFLLVSNFSHAEVLDVTNSKENKLKADTKVVFRGHMKALEVKKRMQDMLLSGLNFGISNYPIDAVNLLKTGGCENKECGTGLCVEVEGQGACRCLPGQEPQSCQAIDCRGEENYCGSSNNTKCVYAPHLSAFTCRCPLGMAGEHCDVNVCDQLGDDVCSVNGQCVGDLFNFTVCACDDFFWGPFCEERGQIMPLSTCQKHKELNTKLLQHLQGTGQLNTDLLNGRTMTEQLQTLGYHNLQVPSCNNGNGEYLHMCVYNITNVDVSMCYCTHPNGTYNGLDYVDESCKEPSAFDPDEKAGACPPISEDSALFQCRHDADCEDDKKCCRAGVGRLCKTPFTGADHRGHFGHHHGHDRHNRVHRRRWRTHHQTLPDILTRHPDDRISSRPVPDTRLLFRPSVLGGSDFRWLQAALKEMKDDLLNSEHPTDLENDLLTDDKELVSHGLLPEGREAEQSYRGSVDGSRTLSRHKREARSRNLLSTNFGREVGGRGSNSWGSGGGRGDDGNTGRKGDQTGPGAGLRPVQLSAGRGGGGGRERPSGPDRGSGGSRGGGRGGSRGGGGDDKGGGRGGGRGGSGGRGGNWVDGKDKASGRGGLGDRGGGRNGPGDMGGRDGGRGGPWDRGGGNGKGGGKGGPGDMGGRDGGRGGPWDRGGGNGKGGGKDGPGDMGGRDGGRGGPWDRGGGNGKGGGKGGPGDMGGRDGGRGGPWDRGDGNGKGGGKGGPGDMGGRDGGRGGPWDRGDGNGKGGGKGGPGDMGGRDGGRGGPWDRGDGNGKGGGKGGPGGRGGPWNRGDGNGKGGGKGGPGDRGGGGKGDGRPDRGGGRGSGGDGGWPGGKGDGKGGRPTRPGHGNSGKGGGKGGPDPPCRGNKCTWPRDGGGGKPGRPDGSHPPDGHGPFPPGGWTTTRPGKPNGGGQKGNTTKPGGPPKNKRRRRRRRRNRLAKQRRNSTTITTHLPHHFSTTNPPPHNTTTSRGNGSGSSHTTPGFNSTGHNHSVGQNHTTPGHNHTTGYNHTAAGHNYTTPGLNTTTASAHNHTHNNHTTARPNSRTRTTAYPYNFNMQSINGVEYTNTTSGNQFTRTLATTLEDLVGVSNSLTTIGFGTDTTTITNTTFTMGEASINILTVSHSNGTTTTISFGDDTFALSTGPPMAGDSSPPASSDGGNPAGGTMGADSPVMPTPLQKDPEHIEVPTTTATNADSEHISLVEAN